MPAIMSRWRRWTRPDFPDALAFPVPVHTLGPSHTKWAYSSAFIRGLESIITNTTSSLFMASGSITALQRGVLFRVDPLRMLPSRMECSIPTFASGSLSSICRRWLVWPWSDYRMLRDAAA